MVLSTLHSVAGRFETIRSPKGFTAIVDYAHTPDALTNVLNGIHEVLDGNGRVLTVVGCGGNRDKGKRPLMAKEAARLSDQVILTSDNPRFEEPDAIIQDMVAGLSAADLDHTLCITDRRQAHQNGADAGATGRCRLGSWKGTRRLPGGKRREASFRRPRNHPGIDRGRKRLMVCFEGITYKASDNVGKLPGQAEKDSDNVGKPPGQTEKDSDNVGKSPGQAEKDSDIVGKSPGQSEKDSDIVGRMEIKQIKMNKKKCCIIYLTI